MQPDSNPYTTPEPTPSPDSWQPAQPAEQPFNQSFLNPAVVSTGDQPGPGQASEPAPFEPPPAHEHHGHHPEHQHHQAYHHQPVPAEPAAPVFAAAPSFAPEPRVPEPTTDTSTLNPQPVVQVLSPRGIEYVFLTITLFTAAIGLTAGLLAAANGAFGYEALAFPVALLVVGLPIFAWLFLRLKRAELTDPSAALDASKRRSTQTTQIICFVVCLFSLIGLVSALMAKLGGQLNTNIARVFADVLVLLVIFGGILTYYWRDEHKK